MSFYSTDSQEHQEAIGFLPKEHEWIDDWLDEPVGAILSEEIRFVENEQILNDIDDQIGDPDRLAIHDILLEQEFLGG
jgi:hypothetical protein